MQQQQQHKRMPIRPVNLAALGLALNLLFGFSSTTTAQQHHGHRLRSAAPAPRALHDLSDPGVLPDSRRGDPNVATGTTSEPPKRVWEDRQHVEHVTHQEWLQPWLFAYNAGLVANGLTEGFPDCQWHARVRSSSRACLIAAMNECSCTFINRFAPQQDWNATRQGLLDRYAMYMIQMVPQLDNDTVWRVTGDFFPTMFFSYSLYESANDQMADTTWLDSAIEPGWGKNPFREVIPPQAAGGYQIHFTRSGAFLSAWFWLFPCR